LIEREQYYIDLLNPEYNISRVAGSSLGRRHTPETLAKLKGYKLSPERLAKLREGAFKFNSNDEVKAKARARMLILNEKKRIKVEVLDTENRETKNYNSICEAANAIGVAPITLRRAEKVFLEKGI
jgi:group I intron endonuclease